MTEPETGAAAGADGRYPPQPLRDYAFLADGERGALIGARGEVVWLCAPRWDDEAVFASLIGGDGLYAVTPRGRFVPGGYYEQGTLIWRNRWITDRQVVECREALAFPGEPGRLVLLRRLLGSRAPARLSVLLRPAAGYGARPLREVRRAGPGRWTGRVGELYLRWSSSGAGQLTEVSPVDGRLGGELTLPAGGRHDLVLELSRDPFDGPPPDPSRAWSRTEHAWREAVPALRRTLATDDARQSYAVLRGMTSPSGGGMVAAATTSLPERAEEGRNYDYRYAWIRDQCYAGQAAATTGHLPLLDEAVGFVGARLHEHGPDLAPAYTVTGGAIPDQRELNLPGYPGGANRIGNHVNRQYQLDIFGEALLLLAAASHHDRLDGDGWRAAEIAADAVARRWRQPDSGIWELGRRHWTHSRLICAAGLRRMAACAPAVPAARDWSRLADTLLDHTAAVAVHPDGHWQRSPHDPATDAALLLPALRGLLPPEDARTRATLRTYTRELTASHLAYRFRHDERPLQQAEGAFLLCGFVMALALHHQGHELEAHRWFERNRGACGTSGLYAEEYDIAQRQLRGNLPQAFVHALMVESAQVLSGGTRP